MVTRFDILARFTRFLNLVVAQALRNDPKQAWKAEGWHQAYVFELGLLNDGKTYDEYHYEWMMGL